MRYIGSKAGIAKYILPIMLSNRKPGQWWVEPFVGGANIIDKVDGKRIGSDSNHYLIALLKALQNGWIPPTDISKELYYVIRDNKEEYTDELVGFVGFLCSYGSKWMASYACDKANTNFADVGSRVLVKQASNFKDVRFECANYLKLRIPKNSLVYCDPPYSKSAVYRDTIDHNEFWQWCRDKSNEGHTIFVSEYNAPDDFKCIMALNRSTVLGISGSSPRIERLFKYTRENRDQE